VFSMLGLLCVAAAFQLPPSLKQETTRRSALVSGGSLAAAFFSPARAQAESAVPTFSLKGVPGLSSNVKGFGGVEEEGSESGGKFSISGLVGGGDAQLPADLGVFGRGMNKDKSGRLNKCDAKKGCVSTFEDPDADAYIPPWTYQPGYSTQAISPNDARRQALREQAGMDANGGVKPPEKPKKSPDEAFNELKTAIAANNGKVVEVGDRYIRAEFTESGTFGDAVDDVEFLISLNVPVVGYRSAARKGGDIKRQKQRIKELRKSLQEQGWKSVGRQLEGV